MEYVKNETNSVAWDAVHHNIKHIHNILQNTPAYEGYKVMQH